jgi:hypothetical protein
MTNPATQVSLCVQCRAEFDDHLRPLQRQQQAPAAAGAQPATHGGQQGAVADAPSSGGADQAPPTAAPPPAAAPKLLASEVGARRACSVADRRRACRRRGAAKRPCQRRRHTPNPGRATPPAAQVFAGAGAGGVRVPRLYRSRADSGGDDVADRLAARMLQGWAMTGMHCPRWAGGICV